MASNRILLINEEIQKELSSLLRTVKDPRVQDVMISITRVETTPDLRYTKVYVSFLQEEKAEGAMKGMLAPQFEEVVIGHAEVRQTYKVSSVGTVCGCMVKDGKITRDAQVRILRDNIVIHEGEIGSLQRFKDQAKEVTAGYECGMTVAKFNDIKEGDVFECFAMEEVKQ